MKTHSDGYVYKNSRISFHKIILVSILILMMSCSNNSTNHSIQEVDFSKGITNEKQVDLSSVGKSISYIPLETKQGSYIGSLSQIIISTKFIATIDKSNKKVLLFSANGEFLKQIGTNGKGPGEFIHASSIAINDRTDEIALSCLELRKLIIFDIKTNDFKEDNIKLAITNMTFLTSNLLLMKGPTNMSFEYKDNYFSVLNIKTHKKRFLLDVPSSFKHYLNIEVPVYTYNDTTFYRDVYTDIVYGITKNQKIIEKYKLNIGKNNIPTEAFETYDSFIKEMKQSIYLNQMLEDDENIFIKGSNKARLLKLVYQKKSKTCIKLPYYKPDGDCLIYNDLDHGPNFWPKGLTSEGKLFTWLYPYQLLKRSKDSIGNAIPTNNGFSNLLSKVKEDDNPILMIIN